MKFKIMGRKGDAEFDYNDLELAEIKFDELVESNYLPVKVSPSGTKALTKFDPDIEEILWMSKITGG